VSLVKLAGLADVAGRLLKASEDPTSARDQCLARVAAPRAEDAPIVIAEALTTLADYDAQWFAYAAGPRPQALAEAPGAQQG
jgi:hypothetical protein